MGKWSIITAGIPVAGLCAAEPGTSPDNFTFDTEQDACFFWPQLTDHQDGLRIWAACVHPDGTPACNIHFVEFGF